MEMDDKLYSKASFDLSEVLKYKFMQFFNQISLAISFWGYRSVTMHSF